MQQGRENFFQIERDVGGLVSLVLIIGPFAKNYLPDKAVGSQFERSIRE
jgi:hypothetical protein